MVGRRVGELDLPGASVAAGQAIGLGLVVGLAIGLPGAWFAPELMELMSGPDSQAPAIGSGYARWTFLSTPIITLLFLQNAIFRGAGDPILALKVLVLSNCINIVLDPCFIFGLGPFPALGVEGAAVATSIGRVSAVVFQFWLLRSGKCRVPMQRLVRFDWEPMVKLMRLSAGTIGQFLIGTTSWLFLTKLVNHFGDAAGSGYTTALRILMFALLPAWGLSNAAATLVGQNLGARQPERAEAAVWLTARYDVAFLACVTIVMELFPEWIIAWFITDPTIAGHAVDTLRIVAAGYVFYAWGMVAVQAFNGAGDTVTPTWLHVAFFWAFQVPLAAVVAYGTDIGVNGVIGAIPIAESLFAVASVILFRRGRWKTVVV
jgi:putative MATE family efflux protein